MLNIAPLDYERYAALYSPSAMLLVPSIQAPVLTKTVKELDPVSSEMGRRSSVLEDNMRTPKPVSDQRPRLIVENEPGRSLNGLFSADSRTLIDFSNNLQNATPIQLGVIPENVMGLYEHQNNDQDGTVKIVA